MTRAEYEAHCHGQGLDPDFPIQVGKRYRVTGWHTENPLKVMTVWTIDVTPEYVEGYLSHTPITSRSTWTTDMAKRWTWTEVTI